VERAEGLLLPAEDDERPAVGAGLAAESPGGPAMEGPGGPATTEEPAREGKPGIDEGTVIEEDEPRKGKPGLNKLNEWPPNGELKPNGTAGVL
jgi:hypothetical protein